MTPFIRSFVVFVVGLFFYVVALAALTGSASAQSGSQVQLPLETYQALLEASQRPTGPPVGYALSQAEVRVTVTEVDGTTRAVADATLRIETLADGWTLVPLLPSGTALTTATASGRPMQLIPSAQGLLWATDRAGTVDVVLQYEVAGDRFSAGRSVAIPLPAAPSTRLTVTVPGTGLSVAVIPASLTDVREAAGSTTVTAAVPAAEGVQVSWNRAPEGEVTVSRATYSGVAGDEAVEWTAELDVVLSSDDAVLLDLFHRDVALLDVQVDGGEAPISVHGDAFAVNLRGRGAHSVTAQIEVPIRRDSGAPRVELRVPAVPVSRFELRLPGDKEVSVVPLASVDHRSVDGATVATTHLPMTDRAIFSWREAVPEEAVGEVEVRSNAAIYHTLQAEEGVVTVRATTVFEVTRGETSQFQLAVPEGVQINRVTAPTGGLSDWRVSEEGDRVLTVFLDHRVSGEYRFDVVYERLIGTGEAAHEPFLAPLLRALEVHRQRGMAALLASRELALEPVRTEGATRVGENQLPPFVREGVELTVAHTFRYFESAPVLEVRATPPEREQGRFDARVDTLVSLDDVSMSVSATVEVHVKSGDIDSLALFLPADINLLSLSAPSLRRDEATIEGQEQRIDVAFTQGLEGRFRVELEYERIHGEGDGTVTVPIVRVAGAEVAQGRIAIEALAALEISPSVVENLSTVDLDELPQRLVLRTTNPILMAFKYVRTEPRPHLALEVTRHREIRVQAAVIDQAHVRTLYTRSGFTVTVAHFVVRNSRQQFLRVRLPAGSEVWSASVDGRPDAPATAETDGPPEVLINIIHSAEGFPVELIYATRQPELDLFGRLSSELPRPDMVVTHTRWDLFLPDGLRYGEPDADLDLVDEGIPVAGSAAWLTEDQLRSAGALAQDIRIAVPQAGVRFTFERLYANQTEAPLSVTIPYSSPASSKLGLVLSLFGTAFLWVGLVAAARRRRGRAAIWLVGLAVAGLALVLVGPTVFTSELTWPMALSGALVVLLGASALLRRWARAKLPRARG